MIDATFQKAEYERIANRLLEEGMLGHGIHEDLLVESARWFHERIGPANECLADFFAQAIQNHIAPIFALPTVARGSEAAMDLFDFLHHLGAWIGELPGELLRKSPEPLVLVVGHRGVSDQLGAHIMMRGGPSIIFWQTFSSIRKSLGELSYERLSQQIRKTLVHEVIGHQLAFCSGAGPTISEDDIAEILRIAEVDFVKLNDGSALRARDFARSRDLLSAVRRTEYVYSARHAHRYFGNLAELIAFAVEGAEDNALYDYKSILSVLRGSLLREANPVNAAGSRALLYRSHDLSLYPFQHTYVFQSDNHWLETAACNRDERWLSFRDCELRFREHLEDPAPPANETLLSSGQSFSIRIPFDGMALRIRDVVLLAWPQGVYALAGDALQQHEGPVAECDVRFECNDGEDGVAVLTNNGREPVRVTLSRLDATTNAVG